MTTESALFPHVAAVPHPSNHRLAYFFCWDKVVCIKVASGGNDTIEWGPEPVSDWRSLSMVRFGYVDAILPLPDRESGMYFFCDERYAMINPKLGLGASESDTVGWGPNGISRGWATLNKIGFKTVDAVLSNPLDRYEAYFFSGKHYALIHFQPEKNDDYIVGEPRAITDGWPSIKRAGFGKVDTILPDPDNTHQAYVFYREQYVLIRSYPGDRTIVRGPEEVAVDWPSLHEAGFY